ncbi:FKBP-type peptidyl-prolyl cis-trans isomerase [Rhodonellum sp.]|uniref:FKBP-type peptidyl-prolyl cis-trans isomerase n=1 Tax=Rhodonellum sp. TaxID=2231180 RepID=UPI00271FA45E|nr:FKBP-type peptidyl-prolyl cis-trans isomerase [Rhodonellum sp.]MDO9552057.1 peptidylprolyl isomerase [Rhodonellum sp.]
MNIKHSIFSVLSLAIMSVGCIETEKSDFELAVVRDDKIIKEYLTKNNIEATETQVGYYYKKEIANDLGNQIVNDDIVGIYYEIKNIEGQLIESHLDESKPPRLYSYSEGGLIPRAMNFASGLAREGETFTLYIPSYLGYQNYGYQQLVLPNSNLVVKVKYAKTYEKEELKVFEQGLIESYIEEKGLEGFVRSPDGLYVKIVNPGSAENMESKTGSVVAFTYKLIQLEGQLLLAESTNNVPFQISLGLSTNLKFLDLSLMKVNKTMEIEVIAPSHLGYGGTSQVFPYGIRKDLFEKSIINQIARPYEPLLFKATIVDVK